LINFNVNDGSCGYVFFARLQSLATQTSTLTTYPHIFFTVLSPKQIYLFRYKLIKRGEP